MNKEYADLAVMQPAGSGIALLSAAPNDNAGRREQRRATVALHDERDRSVR